MKKEESANPSTGGRCLRRVLALAACVVPILWAGSALAAKPIVVATQEIVSVVVDEDACGLGYTFCNELEVETGDNGPAEAGNRSPVMLVIQVIGPYGNPITGLAQSDFSLTNVQTPSGSAPAIPDAITCPSCFADRGDGAYRLVVYQSVSGGYNPWLAGSWILQLGVTAGQRTIYELVNIEIPPATAP